MNHRSWILLAISLLGTSSAFEETNELVNQEDPNSALEGMWTECVSSLSFTCVQRKTLSFIDRLGRSDKVPLLGGVLTLIRTADGPPTARSIDAIDDTDTLGRLIDESVDVFFDTHVIRFTTPWFLTQDGRSSNTVDFNVNEVDYFEGRKGGGGGGGGGHGGGGGGGKRGMKKMMMMMCMMMVGKMMMLGPLMLGLTKIIALKALLLGSISLLISKIMILKKLKMGGGLGGGGGGGGGWSSGGGGGGGWQSSGSGGGWDRSAHNIAYAAYAE